MNYQEYKLSLTPENIDICYKWAERHKFHPLPNGYDNCVFCQIERFRRENQPTGKVWKAVKTIGKAIIGR